MLLAVFVHAADAVLDDDGDFIGERRIVGAKIRNRQRENVAVAVLVLQSFAGKRGAPGSSAQQEATDAHVGSGPDEVADALESEHRVVNKKWNGVDAVGGVSGSGGDERGHRTGLGDSLFENLAVFGFLVIEERAGVDRLVELADAGINADGAEERLHAEGAGFVRNDRHDELADLRIAQHFAQHAHERHGGGNFAAVAAVEKFLEEFVVIRGDGFGADAALGNVAAKRFAARAQVLHFLAVFRRAVERDFGNRSSVSGMPKRERNSRSSSSLSFFCWCVTFLPSPASPRP